MGFDIIEARDIDVIGTQGIIDRIRAAVGDNYGKTQQIGSITQTDSMAHLFYCDSVSLD